MDIILSNRPVEGKTVIHDVVPGDTLGKIAKKYGVTVNFIKKSNGLTSDVIRVGQKLRIWQGEFNAFVDPEERFIYFGSFGRSDGLGGGDIYRSNKSGGDWLAGVNLGSSVNSRDLDYSPFVSPDGVFLFFTSERSTSNPNRSNNPFDLSAITNSILAPNGSGSDIYWKKK